MINPTGGNIRRDAGGDGHFGASRKKTDDKGKVIRYRHRGVDYVCIPGQEVWMPFSSVIIRRKNPYVGYGGILFRGKGIVGTLFYLKVEDAFIGKEISEGDVIGIAEDISQEYNNIIPHVHFQIDKIDPEILISIYRMLKGKS